MGIAILKNLVPTGNLNERRRLKCRLRVVGRITIWLSGVGWFEKRG